MAIINSEIYDRVGYLYTFQFYQEAFEVSISNNSPSILFQKQFPLAWIHSPTNLLERVGFGLKKIAEVVLTYGDHPSNSIDLPALVKRIDSHLPEELRAAIAEKEAGCQQLVRCPEQSAAAPFQLHRLNPQIPLQAYQILGIEEENRHNFSLIEDRYNQLISKLNQKIDKLSPTLAQQMRLLLDDVHAAYYCLCSLSSETQ